jgi:hypothetical protein
MAAARKRPRPAPMASTVAFTVKACTPRKRTASRPSRVMSSVVTRVVPADGVPGGAGCRALDAGLDVAAQALAGAQGLPEQPAHQRRGHEGGDAFIERLVGVRGLGLGPAVPEVGAGGAGEDREGHAQLDAADQLGAAGAAEVGQDHADDQERLQALAERDQDRLLQHGCSLADDSDNRFQYS